MHPPKHRNKKTLHWYFPITPRGLIFLFFSIFLVIIGFYRGELATTLVGICLVVYMIVSFLLCCISIPLWNKTRLYGSCKNIFSFSLSITNYPVSLLRFLCAQKLFISFSKANTQKDSEPWILSLPFSSSESLHIFDPPSRGVYIPQQATLLLEDFSSFFSFRLFKPAQGCNEPVCFPASPDPYHSEIHIPSSAGQSTGKSTFERSENLYETRVYVPGDDTRKINWKVFAHSQTLTVREGELLPPPSGEIFCFFNTQTTYRPSSELQEMFTVLINRIASYLLERLRDNFNIVLIMPSLTNSHELFRFDNRDHDCSARLLEALSLPALSSEAPSLKSFIQSMPLSATILIVSLPETIPLLPFPKNTFFFTGPFSFTKEKQTLLKILQQFLFLPDSSSEKSTQIYTYHDYMDWVESIKKEGFRAYIV